MRWRIVFGVIVVAAVAFLGIQAVPYGREHGNPPVRVEPRWESSETRALAVRACFDCHSNETTWPWYTSVAPISWLAQWDVDEGRRALNFSEWDRPQREAHESAKTVRKGEMPPWFYILPRPAARLSAAEREALIRGLEATFGGEQPRRRTMMLDGIIPVPTARNEPVLAYAPGSAERPALRRQLEKMSGEVIDIAARIGGERVATGRTAEAVMPHDHRHVLARWHRCERTEVDRAIDAALVAHREWSRTPWPQRAAVFLKAADLLAGPYRMVLNAATMLGQSKTPHQAEIDAACELIDFWRFNVAWAAEIYRQQPESSPGCWNYLDYRPLEGFVLAVTPFNFTSIAGNLPTAPAIMGNAVVWKPASSAIYAAHFIMEVLEAAGLPPGVINMVPGAGPEIAETALASPDLAGIHFTGSTATFQALWESVGRNIGRYRSYPRLVGETGGKDFVVAHPSADVMALTTALTRGAFEFQGQKCSAASRAFIPASLWPRIERALREQVAAIRMGDVADFTNFMGAVIDRNAYSTVKGYLDFARQSPDAEILVGGGADDGKGYFVEPTVVRARRPDLKLMREEIFGPVLTAWVYEDADFDETLALCDRGSPYALTGSVFARDRQAIGRVADALRYAAGNFYVNDKPTGAVVGQQPFGGARASGTNDKAGSPLNLLRWVSPRTIKETFLPPADFRYPFLQPDP